MKAVTAKTAAGFRNILFATDFSEAAAHAIPYVKNIAKHYAANLVAFHVRPPIVNPMTPPGAWEFDVEAAKVQDLQHRQELRDTFAGIPPSVDIAEGDIQSNLRKATENNHTDLVVIGTRGRTGLGKLMLGSVAEEIFREVECPVLTVGPHNEAAHAAGGEIREILFATDFNPEAKGAAAYAISLAQEFQAKLVLLHVIPEQEAGDLVSAADVVTSAHALLEGLVPVEARAWCKPEYFVERGDPAKK